jgi:hypothetical protein
MQHGWSATAFGADDSAVELRFLLGFALKRADDPFYKCRPAKKPPTPTSPSAPRLTRNGLSNTHRWWRAASAARGADPALTLNFLYQDLFFGARAQAQSEYDMLHLLSELNQALAGHDPAQVQAVIAPSDDDDQPLLLVELSQGGAVLACRKPHDPAADLALALDDLADALASLGLTDISVSEDPPGLKAISCLTVTREPRILSCTRTQIRCLVRCRPCAPQQRETVMKAWARIMARAVRRRIPRRLRQPAGGAAPTQLFHDQLFQPASAPVDTTACLRSARPCAPTCSTTSAHHARKDVRRLLFDALYRRDKLQLEYDSAVTRNAAQTFEARAGNCLSLAIMTAALARELNLPVQFQQIEVDEVWSRAGNLYFASNHVNLALGRARPYYANSLTVDFIPVPPKARENAAERNHHHGHVPQQPRRRTAGGGQVDDAYWSARKAAEVDPSSSTPTTRWA